MVAQNPPNNETKCSKFHYLSLAIQSLVTELSSAEKKKKTEKELYAFWTLR
jgi:hypothetical protein